METPVWHPHILSAVLQPDPAEVGQAVTISLWVMDIFGGQQAEVWPSGSVYSGEV